MKNIIFSAIVLFVSASFAGVTRSVCPFCSSSVRPTSKFCASCGRDINKTHSFVRPVTDNEYYNGKKDSFSIPERYSGIWTPIKLSIAGEAGIPYDANCSVFGLDSTVFISQNYSVYGLGIVGLGSTSKEMYGITVAGLGSFTEDAVGIFIGGGFNVADKLTGMQICALRNDAGENSSGVQIGIVNKMGKNSKGLQLGLLNWFDDSCLPLLNMRF